MDRKLAVLEPVGDVPKGSVSTVVGKELRTVCAILHHVGFRPALGAPRVVSPLYPRLIVVEQERAAKGSRTRVSPHAMDGAVFSYDGNGLLRIGGEIDMGTAPELEAALEKCDGDMELRSTFGLPDGNGERPRTPT